MQRKTASSVARESLWIEPHIVIEIEVKDHIEVAAMVGAAAPNRMHTRRIEKGPLQTERRIIARAALQIRCSPPLAVEVILKRIIAADATIR